MYAIIKTGGKQVKVAKGDKLNIEKLDVAAGEKVTLDNVLLIADGDNMTVGSPYVDGATVEATVLEQIKDKKVIVFKKKRRQNYRRKKGHRQMLSVIEVTAINASAKKAEKKAAPAKKAAKTDKAEAKTE